MELCESWNLKPSYNDLRSHFTAQIADGPVWGNKRGAQEPGGGGESTPICFLLVIRIVSTDTHSIELCWQRGKKNRGQFEVPDNCLHTPSCENELKKKNCKGDLCLNKRAWLDLRVAVKHLHFFFQLLQLQVSVSYRGSLLFKHARILLHIFWDYFEMPQMQPNGSNLSQYRFFVASIYFKRNIYTFI